MDENIWADLNRFNEASLAARQDSDKLHREKRVETRGVMPHEHRPNMEGAIHDEDYEVFDKVLGDPSFAAFAKRAQQSKRGYAIRVNPLTGEKEMFIAGTQFEEHGGNWFDLVLYQADNAAVGSYAMLQKGLSHVGYHGLPNSTHTFDFFAKLDVRRSEHVTELEAIAHDNKVDVIYGYSRGGAIMSEMQTDASKLGLSSAKIISHNMTDLNLYEGDSDRITGVYDFLLGGGFVEDIAKSHGLEIDLKNRYYDLSPNRPHQVWGPGP
jgi:hypothetical protein